jgi:hypothetical protein
MTDHRSFAHGDGVRTPIRVGFAKDAEADDEELNGKTTD